MKLTRVIERCIHVVAFTVTYSLCITYLRIQQLPELIRLGFISAVSEVAHFLVNSCDIVERRAANNIITILSSLHLSLSLSFNFTLFKRRFDSIRFSRSLATKRFPRFLLSGTKFWSKPRVPNRETEHAFCASYTNLRDLFFEKRFVLLVSREEKNCFARRTMERNENDIIDPRDRYTLYRSLGPALRICPNCVSTVHDSTGDEIFHADCPARDKDPGLSTSISPPCPELLYFASPSSSIF